MSNRAFHQGATVVPYPKVVELYAKVTFGGAGAPTLDAIQSRGVLSCTRNAAGKYTFVFGSKVNKASVLDSHVRLLGAEVVFNTAGVGADTVPAAPQLVILADNVADGTKASIQVGLFDLETPAETEVASGEIGYFVFKLLDTKAG